MNLVCGTMQCSRPENMPSDAGVWFSRYKDMFAHYEASPDKQKLFCVSWDRANATNLGSKMFGIFQTPVQYFRTIQQMQAGTVCGYEIILEGQPCKLYLDVEWETDGAVDGQASETVDAICSSVTENVRKQFIPAPTPALSEEEKKQQVEAWRDLKPEFYISTCSRMKNKTVFKNSFHIVVHNVIFPNNHDGMMKEFIMSLGFPDHIDKAVYSRNRCIRTELSAKLGQACCFQNVEALSPAALPEDRERQLLQSLITIFDRELPSVIYKDAGLALAFKKEGSENKRIVQMIQSAAGKRAKTPSNQVSVVLDAYFKHIFCDDAHTTVTIRDIRDTDPLPPAAKRLLERGIVTPGNIFFVYILNPKWCVSKLMHAVKHSHNSNNACAVAIDVNGKINIYARCYGCESSEYRALSVFTNRLLPSLDTNDAFRRIIHSPYGIKCVKDSQDRQRVVNLFQKTEDTVKKLLDSSKDSKKYTDSIHYLWVKYVDSAARGWFFISEPCHPLQVQDAAHSKNAV